MNMKKPRNIDYAKLRRPLKRSKISDGFYGSTFLYMRFLMIWAIILMADFVLEFQFEYLWPIYLMGLSLYDSFKFQGLAFSIFFVSVAITSDVVCYLFIPVQWLFFAASTYVWVQYVWQTDRGICLPTVSLWLLFVYIEVSVRLRDFKNLPFNVEICRPLAAHCIGYPFVTLGFGFKTYVSYKFRLRKQKEVQKVNDFYFQLLSQALPPELQNLEKQKALPAKSEEDIISNEIIPADKSSVQTSPTSTALKSSKEEKESKKSNKAMYEIENADEIQYIEQSTKKTSDINNFDETSANLTNEQNIKSFKQNGISKVSSTKSNSCKENSTKKGKTYNKTDLSSTSFANNKDESAYIQRLESDVKRFKTDLQISRYTEQELKSQISSFILGDKNTRSELYQLQQDNENLQNKLHNLVTSRQKDKESLSLIEKKLQEEKKARSSLELQLMVERKAKKAEDAAAARAVALVMARGDCCTDLCMSRRRDTENDVLKLRWDVQNKEDKLRQLEKELQSLRQYTDQQTDTEVLMSALAAMQEKTSHLENSLSAETRLKLNLFSALGEAKRQMEILQGLILKRDLEILDLKSRMTEMMALMPQQSSDSMLLSSLGNSSTSPLYSVTSCQSYNNDNGLIKSSLNPHASDYTPKPL